MFSEFDKYILEFAMEDFAVDYWYDEGVDIAEDMICKFNDEDWKELLRAIPVRTVEWKKRLAYCMHDGNDLNQLGVLLNLIETEDSELFEIVVDSLRGFTGNESRKLIQGNERIVSKIEKILPKAGTPANVILEDFLKTNQI